MSNAQVAHDVLEELLWEPTIDSSRINVTTDDGAVVLSGVVATHYESETAGEAAWRVAGVTSVRNDLVVDTAAGAVLDSELSATAQSGLDANGLVPRGAISVEARDGWVTMTGNVHHQFQREAAERVVRHLRGLRGYTDLVTVSRDPAEAVSEGITEALTRSANVDADGIQVSDAAGVVTLSGSVGSHAERQEAENAAWLAAGVVDVRNNLVITNRIHV
jgi:osmotically-inducible protein OsmY